MRGIAAFLLLGCSVPALAQELRIDTLEHYTDNRGWNEAGLGPVYQSVVSFNVVPSGFPTLAFVEQGSFREAATHFAMPVAKDAYSFWRHFDPALTGAWRVIALRGDGKEVSRLSPALAKPQRVPLIERIEVAGEGAEPRLSWKLPDLSGFDIERIRVGVRGGARVHNRFLSLLWVSGDLPPTATSFRIPAGVLARGESYVFQVMLEDLEGGRLENRSQSFADSYTVPR